jgi:hypothetical protein
MPVFSEISVIFLPVVSINSLKRAEKIGSSIGDVAEFFTSFLGRAITNTSLYLFCLRACIVIIIHYKGFYSRARKIFLKK